MPQKSQAQSEPVSTTAISPNWKRPQSPQGSGKLKATEKNGSNQKKMGNQGSTPSHSHANLLVQQLNGVNCCQCCGVFGIQVKEFPRRGYGRRPVSRQQCWNYQLAGGIMIYKKLLRPDRIRAIQGSLGVSYLAYLVLSNTVFYETDFMITLPIMKQSFICSWSWPQTARDSRFTATTKSVNIPAWSWMNTFWPVTAWSIRIWLPLTDSSFKFSLCRKPVPCLFRLPWRGKIRSSYPYRPRKKYQHPRYASM